MKKFFLAILLSVSSLAFPQKKDNTNINPGDFEKVQVELQKQAEVQKHLIIEIESLNEKIATLSSENTILKEESSVIKSDLQKLASESNKSDKELSQKIDKNFSKLSQEYYCLKDCISATRKDLQNSMIELQSELTTKLENQYHVIESKQKADKDTLKNELSKTNKSIGNTQDELSSLGSTSIIIATTLVVIIATLAFLLSRKIKQGYNGIDEIKKAHDTLRKAHIAMQEESIKLDNKLLEIAEKQLTVTPNKIEENEMDHSLALKVADEIVRIETNLSRMDTNIKGHKQLSKAVERIKNNFYANGYEIVDMLGKKYTQGMKAAVTFVTDETLNEGEQIITKIIKPQINYKNEMIQAAQIEVSQAE